MAFKGKALAPLQVVVVNRDKGTLLYFQDVLQAAEDFRFAGGFSNAAEALKSIPALQPELVLMGIRLPDLNGIECIKRLKCELPHLKIVIITGKNDAGSVHHSW